MKERGEWVLTTISFSTHLQLGEEGFDGIVEKKIMSK